MFASLTETAVLAVLPALGYRSDRVRLGMNVDEIYWYFVVVAAFFVYGIVFYAPKVI